MFDNLLAKQPATDSFCQVYQPVIVDQGDGKIVAKDSVKGRIVANERTYRGVCP